ncbi:Lipoyltransferase (Lipoyl-(acyl-carrier protein)-protein-N-lipoyltransferase) (Lipoate-protein ligase B) [Thiocapsa sp. KS1]|nr:lipoyl(octanoyl) transferase LipB [Thiocapsa sp. KS1]CRI65262.1 Lipoyltransferase (Lipoyl-(acyl-carrier protein)-protein-N-lipoyltransferase) (Lipoate-protein ligase B) [Thiocapsa sp. KS1]
MSPEPDAPRRLLVRRLPGYRDYLPTLEAMREFTDLRGPDTPDELWLLEHPPVFTLGQAGREEHLLDPGPIPVIKVDRGGQVTYHGPGQLVVYVLLDLRRAGLGVKRLVGLLEQAVIDLLATLGVTAERRADAPGVYVAGAKVASLGLRIRNGCSYHGLALNVSLDLDPFGRINPCGYPGLAVTRVTDLASGASMPEIETGLVRLLAASLGMTATRREV